MQPNAIPYGYCQCGCGGKTRLARATDPRYGHVKGQPVRFLKGHHRRVQPASEETRSRLRESIGRGSAHASWKAEGAAYRTLHARLNRSHPRSGVCEACGATGRMTHYALIHGHEYSDQREDYRELCVRCHAKYDGFDQRVVSSETREKISAAKKAMYASRPAPTHCNRGHEFTSDNTYVHPTTGTKRCRICMNAQQQTRRAAAT